MIRKENARIIFFGARWENNLGAHEIQNLRDHHKQE